MSDLGEFSNFSGFQIKINSKLWPTTEHYFQTMKFESTNDQQDIRRTKSPMEAAKNDRDRKRKLKQNWDSIKVGDMREALLAKFTQYDELSSLLLCTGDSKLIEHTENIQHIQRTVQAKRVLCGSQRFHIHTKLATLKLLLV